jgi:hypothetical protein
VENGIVKEGNTGLSCDSCSRADTNQATESGRALSLQGQARDIGASQTVRGRGEEILRGSKGTERRRA